MNFWEENDFKTYHQSKHNNEGGNILRGIFSVTMKVYVMFFIYIHNLFVIFASQNVT